MTPERKNSIIDEALLFTSTFRMIGDSMDNNSKRYFIEGDLLRCDEVYFQSVEVGSKYVIMVDDVSIVRQAACFDGEYMTATPLDPAYRTFLFSETDVQQLFLV